MNATSPINHDNYDNAYLKAILCDNKRVAMVGASSNRHRPSSFVLRYLIGKGFELMPINPGHAEKEFFGARVYASLADVPAPAEIVDIFRNSEAALAVTREAIGLKDKLGIKVIWMQLGVRNNVAADEAEAAGLKVVMNRCPKIEYGRLCGESGWMGVNANMISSRPQSLAGAGTFQQHVLRSDKAGDETGKG